MQVKEALQTGRYPQLRGLLSILPDDAYVNADNEWHSHRLGMRLEMQTEIATEVLEAIGESGSLHWLVKDWYRKLHESLIQSELDWSKKLQLRTGTVPTDTPSLPPCQTENYAPQ